MEEIKVVSDKTQDNGEASSDVEPSSDVETDDDATNEEGDYESESDNDTYINNIDPEKADYVGGNKPYKIGGADGDIEINDEEGSEDEDDDYLQKFNQDMRDDLILNFHPESKSHNYEEIKQLAKVTRNKNGIIVDELHKTIPLLTKYEKTRILGQRAKQIECGAVPLVQVPPNIIDCYLIAKLELEQNKLPFIIRRPLPSGGMEYWYVSDLENV